MASAMYVGGGVEVTVFCMMSSKKKEFLVLFQICILYMYLIVLLIKKEPKTGRNMLKIQIKTLC